jgi:thiol-disulfide isomerase/thioredoxin
MLEQAMLMRFLSVSLMSVLVLLSGCNKPADFDANAQDKTDDTVDTSRDPDGNSEPPLDDVTDELKDIPPASGAANSTDDNVKNVVKLSVVTPEAFDEVLAKHKGNVVLIDFWATYCPPCRKAFPHSLALNEKYAKDGLTVLSMSLDDVEDQELALKFLNATNATIDNYLCSLGASNASMEAFGIAGMIPHYKVFGRDGELHKTFSGNAVKAEDIEQTIHELVAQK